MRITQEIMEHFWFVCIEGCVVEQMEELIRELEKMHCKERTSEAN